VLKGEHVEKCKKILWRRREILEKAIMIMASKRRSRTVEIRVNYTTRRAKSNRQTKKLEDSKLISEQQIKRKNVIREIEKPKPITDKKPQDSKPKTTSKQRKQKKIHKCTICLKEFKGKCTIPAEGLNQILTENPSFSFLKD
jgi:ribosomal protein L37AE/L43A